MNGTMCWWSTKIDIWWIDPTVGFIDWLRGGHWLDEATRVRGMSGRNNDKDYSMMIDGIDIDEIMWYVMNEWGATFVITDN
jgi:mono/diheme cytochrome c family protein